MNDNLKDKEIVVIVIESLISLAIVDLVVLKLIKELIIISQ